MKKSPYLAFTSLGYRILHLITTLGFIMIGFLADVYIGSIGVVMISAGIPLILVFLDYFAFSGASSRKQKSMQFVKSSCKGFNFFKSALKTDIWVKQGCIVLGYLGYILAELIYFTDSEAFFHLSADIGAYHKHYPDHLQKDCSYHGNTDCGMLHLLHAFNHTASDVQLFDARAYK
jgi:hypothetical protein